MIQIPGFPDYFVDGTDIISMKFGKVRVIKQSINSRGYKTLKLDGKCKLAHRLIAQAYFTNYSEDLFVDHIDRDKTNNMLCNLRMVTRSENLQNTSSKGYYFHKQTGKWMAYIMVNNKFKYLKLHDTESEARETYLAAKENLHTYWASIQDK